MEQYRKQRAAQQRRRKKARARAMGIVLGVAACAALTVFGSALVKQRMNSDNAVQGNALSMPTQMASGTLAPVHTDYIFVTPNPTMEVVAVSPDSENGWMLMLVNATHSIPEGYAPPELTVLSNGESVDKRIYPSLQQMFDDARAQGVYPFVRSGYRTNDEQQQTMDEKIAEYVEQGLSEDEARQKAEGYVAIPGTSEHETGLAVDINADTDRSERDEVYAWLADNCAKYGFILRYPEDKTEVTGISYEPWHFRYVGEDAAREIMDNGLCLEEYLGAVN